MTPDFALTDAEIHALGEPRLVSPRWRARSRRAPIGVHDAVEALGGRRPAPPGGTQPGRRVSRRQAVRGDAIAWIDPDEVPAELA